MALRKLAAIVSLILMWPSCLSKLHNFFSIIVCFTFLTSILDFYVNCPAVQCDMSLAKVTKLTEKLQS